MTQSGCIPLLTHSLNGSVAKRLLPNGSCIIIKFEKNASVGYDLLPQDALVMKAIQAANIRFKHNLLTSSQGSYVVEFIQSNIMVFKDPVTGKECLAEDQLLSNVLDPKLATYCLVTYGVSSPVTLYGIENAYRSNPNRLGTLMVEVNRFFANLMRLASMSGFSHGDMHAGNVLWDQDQSRFVLIDYGRAFIDPSWVPVNAISETAMAQRLGEIYNDPSYMDHYKSIVIGGVSFPILSSFTKVTPKDANTETKLAFMMSLDIAGLCFYLYENNTTFIQSLYPHAKNLYPIELDAQGNILTLTCDTRALKQHNPVDMFDMGLHTFYALMDALDERTFCDALGRIVWDKVAHAGIFFPGSNVITSDAADMFYKFTFVHKTTVYDSSGGNRNSNSLSNRNSTDASPKASLMPATTRSLRQKRSKMQAALSTAAKKDNPWEAVYATKKVLTPTLKDMKPLAKEAFKQGKEPILRNRDLSHLFRTTRPHLVTPRPQRRLAISVVGGSKTDKRYVQIKGRTQPSRVYMDVHQKPYIRLKKTKVYLSQIKGQYRYA